MTKERKQQIQYLLGKYVDSKASSKEEELLFQLFDEEKESSEWELLIEELMWAEPESLPYDRDQWQPVVQSILEHKTGRVATLRQLPVWVRWVAAASVISFIAIAAVLILYPEKPQHPVAQRAVQTDILPGTKKATLILADGREIILDSAQSGVLAKQGATNISNSGGQLVYDRNNDGKMRYNILVTHKGQQYPLTLSDGTKIIVDASTTIRFPVAFTERDRTVEINGRAWFEVAKDPAKPFYVVKGEKKVQVFGTKFDVNAFDNEGDIKVTLVEGSVQVTNGSTRQLLKPGQQAVLSGNTNAIQLIADADIDQATAWKNGEFAFHSADIATILREIERWYDVEVEIRGTLPRRSFFLEGSRNAKLSELLRGFEVNHIPFTIDGEKRRLIVNP